MLRTTRRAGARVVVVGGGIAGVEAALALRKRLRRRDTVTLVAHETVLVHRPDALYVPFGGAIEPIMHPLAAPIREAGIEIVPELAHAIDPTARIVATARHELRYDAAVIATGASARLDDIPGFAANAQILWRLPDLIRLRIALQDLGGALRRGARATVLFVVPPGNRWAGPVYETALMLDTWLRRRRLRGGVEIRVATAERALLESLGAGAHATLRRELAAREIESHVAVALARVDAGRAHFDGGRTIDFDLLVGGVPYAAGALLAELPADERGLVQVDAGSMAVQGIDGLFAVGDATSAGVKQAPAAIANASVGAESVRCMLRGQPLPNRESPRPIYLMDALDRAICVVGPPGLADLVQGEEGSRASTSPVWRLARRAVAGHLARRFGAGRPVTGGARWLGMRAAEAGLVAALAD